MKPKLKLGNEKLYINETWACNGYWIVRLDWLSHRALTPFKMMASLKAGVYHDGPKSAVDITAKMPDLSQFTSDSKEGLQRLAVAPHGVKFGVNDALQVTAYKFKSLPVEGEKEFEIGISTDYARLMDLGAAWSRNANSAVKIFDGNDVLVAVVMPMRLT